MKSFALIVFAVLPLIGGIMALRVWLFLRNAKRTVAKIIGHKVTQFSESDQSLPIVTFHDEFGRFHRVTLPTERPIKQRGVGADEVRIVYQPENAEKARIDYWGTLWIAPIFLCTPAILLLVALLWIEVCAYFRL